jgi:hypothetical protein
VINLFHALTVPLRLLPFKEDLNSVTLQNPTGFFKMIYLKK